MHVPESPAESSASLQKAQRIGASFTQGERVASWHQHHAPDQSTSAQIIKRCVHLREGARADWDACDLRALCQAEEFRQV